MFKVNLWPLEKIITRESGAAGVTWGHLVSLKAGWVRKEARLSQNLGLPSQLEHGLLRDLGSLRRNEGISQKG